MSGTVSETLLREAAEKVNGALLRLVKYVEPLAGPEGRARRKELGLEPKSFDSRDAYDGLVREASQHRGACFGGLGAVVGEPFLQDLEGEDPIPANDAGVEAFATGFLHTDGQFIVSFSAPASLVRAAGGRTVAILDRAAAAELDLPR